MDEDVRAFARTFQDFVEAMSRAAGEARPSPIRELLDRQVGEPSSVRGPS